MVNLRERVFGALITLGESSTVSSTLGDIRREAGGEVSPHDIHQALLELRDKGRIRIAYIEGGGAKDCPVEVEIIG